MKFKWHFYFLYIIFIILSIQCSKYDPCKGLTKKTFTDTAWIENIYKSKIPYHCPDTLVYLSNFGDSAVLYGSCSHSFFSNKTSAANNIDCPDDIITVYEKIDYRFKGNNVELSDIQLGLSSFHTSINNYKPGIFFGIDKHHFVDYEFYFPYNQDSIFVNNVTIIGNLFYTDRYTALLLYNYVYGLIRINYNGKIWTIRNIK